MMIIVCACVLMSCPESQKRQMSSSPQKKAGLIMTAVRAAQKQLGREPGSVEVTHTLLYMSTQRHIFTHTHTYTHTHKLTLVCVKYTLTHTHIGLIVT